MSKILPFVNDPGIKREWHDHEDGTFTVVEKEDVSALLDQNKKIQNDHDGYTQSRDMQWVARIDRTTIADYAARGINLFHPMHEPELRKLLNDPDYRGLRTGLGHIGPKHRHI